MEGCQGWTSTSGRGSGGLKQKENSKQNALGEDCKVKVIMILVTKDGQGPEVDLNKNRAKNKQLVRDVMKSIHYQLENSHNK